MGADSVEDGFWRHHGPLGWLELYALFQGEVDHFEPMDSMLFYGQLEPTLDEDGDYRYKCGYFVRGDDGLGNCTAYDHRPWMCREYPYGKPAQEFADCSWNVELIEFEVVQGVLT